MHAQSCPTLSNPMDCSPPGFSAHETPQAGILEWVAISFSRGSFRPRDQTHDSWVSCMARWILYHCTTREDIYSSMGKRKKQTKGTSRYAMLCCAWRGQFGHAWEWLGYWMVREVLSVKVTLMQTAKGRKDREHAKIKGERIPDRIRWNWASWGQNRVDKGVSYVRMKREKPIEEDPGYTGPCKPAQRAWLFVSTREFPLKLLSSGGRLSEHCF